jgi:hypothetical protein
MEKGPSEGGQEIPRILWKPDVHYRIHKSSPPDPTLSHMSPVQTLISKVKYRFFTAASIKMKEALMMAVVSTSETSVSFYKTARRNIPENNHPQIISFKTVSILSSNL